MKINTKLLCCLSVSIASSITPVLITSCNTTPTEPIHQNIFNIKDGVLLGVKDGVTEQDLKAQIKNNKLILPKVPTIGANAFNNQLFKSLPANTNIVIESETVEEYAFYGTDAKEVTIAEGVSLKTIGNSAFAGASQLTKFTFPATVTTIGSNAFIGCTSMTQLDFSAFTDATKIPAIGGTSVFAGLPTANGNLTVHDATVGAKLFTACTEGGLYPSWTQYKSDGTQIGDQVKIMPSYMFATQENSGVLTITGFKSALADRVSLYNKMVIPETINGKTVEAIADNAFATNSGGVITSLIPNIKYLVLSSKLKSVGAYNFATTKLVSLDCSNCTALTNIGKYCFDQCANLVTVNLKNTAVKDIREYCFRGCTALITMSLPQNTFAIWSNAFRGCTAMETITIPASTAFIALHAFQCVTTAKWKNIIFEDTASKYTLHKTDKGDTDVDNYFVTSPVINAQLLSNVNYAYGIYKHIVSFNQSQMNIANIQAINNLALPYSIVTQWSTEHPYTLEWSLDKPLLDTTYSFTEPSGETPASLSVKAIDSILGTHLGITGTVTVKATYNDYFTSEEVTKTYTLALKTYDLYQGSSLTHLKPTWKDDDSSFKIGLQVDEGEVPYAYEDNGLVIPDVISTNDHVGYVTEIAADGWTKAKIPLIFLPESLKIIDDGALTMDKPNDGKIRTVRFKFNCEPTDDEYIGSVYPNLSIGANAFNSTYQEEIFIPECVTTIKSGTFAVTAESQEPQTKTIHFPGMLQSIEANTFSQYNIAKITLDLSRVSVVPQISNTYSLPDIAHIESIKIHSYMVEAFKKDEKWKDYESKFKTV